MQRDGYQDRQRRAQGNKQRKRQDELRGGNDTTVVVNIDQRTLAVAEDDLVPPRSRPQDNILSAAESQQPSWRRR